MDCFVRTLLSRAQALAGAALLFFVLMALSGASRAQDPALRVSAQGSSLYLDMGGSAAESRLRVTLPGHISAVALSGSGQVPVVAAATVAPYALYLFDQRLQLLKTLRLTDRTAKSESAVCAIFVAGQRQSFVVVFRGLPELWEVSYNPASPEIGLGMVHDFQYREGHFVPGYLNPLRTSLPWSVAAVGLDAEGHMVQLRSRAEEQGGDTLVVHLDVRKPVAEQVRMTAPMRSCDSPDLLQK